MIRSNLKRNEMGAIEMCKNTGNIGALMYDGINITLEWKTIIE